MDITSLVRQEVLWWIGQREAKLTDLATETMSLNPFLAPFIYEFHSHESIDDLFELLISGHLLTGHATGFGKLVDEKILPKVFGATKLSAKWRMRNYPYSESEFDEIDHLVVRDGNKHLLSLKAGKWTIQLTMAVQLNETFKKITESYLEDNDKIVVGVFYGSPSDLTDKYDIIRGINRGADHKVHDIRKHVEVKCGREFWEWISGGDPDAQQKVLRGIIEAIKHSGIRQENRARIQSFKDKLLNLHNIQTASSDDSFWADLLRNINR